MMDTPMQPDDGAKNPGAATEPDQQPQLRDAQQPDAVGGDDLTPDERDVIDRTVRAMDALDPLEKFRLFRLAQIGAQQTGMIRPDADITDRTERPRETQTVQQTTSAPAQQDLAARLESIERALKQWGSELQYIQKERQRAQTERAISQLYEMIEKTVRDGGEEFALYRKSKDALQSLQRDFLDHYVAERPANIKTALAEFVQRRNNVIYSLAEEVAAEKLRQKRLAAASLGGGFAAGGQNQASAGSTRQRSGADDWKTGKVLQMLRMKYEVEAD